MVGSSTLPGSNSHSEARYCLSARAPSSGSHAPGRTASSPLTRCTGLFQVVADKDLLNQKQVRDYTYIAREVETRLNRKGETEVEQELKTYEVLEIYGEPGKRLIAKNDKLLDSEEAA